MKVKAIKRGYFGGEYRLPGDVFDCPSNKEFSNRWMQKVTKGKQVELPIKDEKRFDSLEIPSLEFPEVVNKASPVI